MSTCTSRFHILALFLLFFSYSGAVYADGVTVLDEVTIRVVDLGQPAVSKARPTQLGTPRESDIGTRPDRIANFTSPGGDFAPRFNAPEEGNKEVGNKEPVSKPDSDSNRERDVPDTRSIVEVPQRSSKPEAPDTEFGEERRSETTTVKRTPTKKQRPRCVPKRVNRSRISRFSRRR